MIWNIKKQAKEVTTHLQPPLLITSTTRTYDRRDNFEVVSVYMRISLQILLPVCNCYTYRSLGQLDSLSKFADNAKILLPASDNGLY